jgi:hypothetical protein
MTSTIEAIGTQQTVFVDLSPGGSMQELDLEGTDITHGMLRTAFSSLKRVPTARETHMSTVVEIWPRLGREALEGLFEQLGAGVTFSERATAQLTQDHGLNTA